MDKKTTTLSMTEFRRKASDIVARVYWTGEEVVLTSKGKPMVKLVSVRGEEETGK